MDEEAMNAAKPFIINYHSVKNWTDLKWIAKRLTETGIAGRDWSDSDVQEVIDEFGIARASDLDGEERQELKKEFGGYTLEKGETTARHV